MHLKSCRVLVTPTSFGQYNKQLKTDLEEAIGEVIYNTTGHPLTSDELTDILPGIDGYIAGLDWIDHAALDAADKLKVIARYGVGVDRVDLDTSEAKGIVVTNTPGANSASVAELTIGLILSLARHIPKGVKATREGEWPRLNGLSLSGKTVGLVGLGARNTPLLMYPFPTCSTCPTTFPNSSVGWVWTSATTKSQFNPLLISKKKSVNQPVIMGPEAM